MKEKLFCLLIHLHNDIHTHTPIRKNKSEIPRKRKQNRNIANTLGSSTYKTPELVALSPIWRNGRNVLKTTDLLRKEQSQYTV